MLYSFNVFASPLFRISVSELSSDQDLPEDLPRYNSHPLEKNMEKTKSGVPGVYIRRLNLNIHDITKHRRLLNYLQLYYRRNHSTFGFAPEIHQILKLVPSLCFVPSFLLAYTCCRVNELKQIPLTFIKGSGALTLVSSKGGHKRQIPPFNPYKDKLLQSIDPKTLIIVVSYDHLRNSIAKARDRAGISIGDDHQDCTHIFRHLQATFMRSKGVEVDDISAHLGHFRKSTTYQYIHLKKGSGSSGSRKE